MDEKAVVEQVADTRAYSRANPSARYRELVGLYQRMHVDGGSGIPAVDMFAGKSLAPHLAKIKSAVRQTGATSLLDYGCGKGLLYRSRDIQLPGGERIASVRDYLGADTIACYDPAVQEFMIMPEGQFDGVISTDVLEHCPEDDLPWIVDEMFSKARKFVYANVAAFAALKTLPNGENAHCTVRPASWWGELVAPIAARYPHVLYQFAVSRAHQGW